ncbi:MAG TPA: hypothetical protein VMV07_14985, partial [Streptosporangiaceae bacterium]|nr:hypothetical protein [Streptosporangiaceae bacterium]HVB45662.1 hypothetical protein [Streptosporangiaceae bacterium]
VYIGAHYPQDVAAGFLLGAGVVLAGYAIARRPLTVLVRLLTATPLRPLLTTTPAATAATQPSSQAQQAAGPASGLEPPHPAARGTHWPDRRLDRWRAE